MTRSDSANRDSENQKLNAEDLTARMNVLVNAEAQLENILKNLNGVVQRHRVLPDGTREALYISDGIEKITGLKPEAVYSNPEILWNQIFPEDEEALRGEIDKAIADKGSWHRSWRIQNSRGEMKWINGSGVCSELSNGEVVIDSVITDITALREARQKLVEANRKYKLAAKAAHLGLWEYEGATERLTWDSEMFNLFGVSEADFGHSFEDWRNTLHPEDEARAVREVYAAFERKVDFDTQFRIIRADNKKVRHIRATAKVLTDEFGKNAKMIGLNWDVTFMVEAQEKLAESNRRYELASKATSDAIWDWDLKKGKLTWSKAFFDIFGYDSNPNENEFERWKECIHPEDRQRVVNSVESFDGQPGAIWEESYRFMKGDNTYAHVVDRGFLIRNFHGEAYRMVGAMRDTTQLTQFLTAIKEQNSKLKEIAWTQSHELRGPLTKILGLIELARAEQFKDMSVDEFLKYLEDSAHEMDTVIRKIVAASSEVDLN